MSEVIENCDVDAASSYPVSISHGHRIRQKIDLKAKVDVHGLAEKQVNQVHALAVDPARYLVAAEVTDAGEVNLEQEVVIGPDGRRLTEQDAQEFTERRGRPSLSGDRGKSPQVAFRLSRDLHLGPQRFRG